MVGEGGSRPNDHTWSQGGGVCVKKGLKYDHEILERAGAAENMKGKGGELMPTKFTDNYEGEHIHGKNVEITVSGLSG